MALDPTGGKVTTGSKVTSGTLLSIIAASGEPCRFLLGCDAILWPLQVADVALEDARTHRVYFRTDQGIDLADISLATRSLHLTRELLTIMPMHEAVLCGLYFIDVVSSAGLATLVAMVSRFASNAARLAADQPHLAPHVYQAQCARPISSTAGHWGAGAATAPAPASSSHSIAADTPGRPRRCR